MCWPSGHRWPVAEPPVAKPPVAEPAVTELELDMGLTHAEFFRTLPAAMSGGEYRIEGSSVIAEQGEQRLRIALDPQTERRIALLSIPSTRVRFRFDNYSPAEVDAFMTQFHRHFQRGGG